MKEATKEQERAYSLHREAGWEFSHWEDDCVIMARWDQHTAGSRTRIMEVAIKADGTRAERGEEWVCKDLM